ncbi:glycosyltransferase [Butyrivibrio sp. MC2021]|uniref:glycosyltransferase n=1 Tax=Butyrivibrio sp. MC2021 TaxID=1408306 RepID=UPI0006849AB7|nr:glycosyltransferase [Butyrivibrio sp. MC2021]
MKILMVNKFLHPNGGSETYIFKLGDALKALGHEVQYFGMEHEGRCVSNNVGAYTSDMDFHGGSKLSKLTYPVKTIYSREARKKIRLVLEDFQPDVVHLNNFNYQLTPSVILEVVKWRKQVGKNCRIVFTAHDYQLLCPNHMMNNPGSRLNCEKCLGGHFVNCIKGKCIHGSAAKSAVGAAEAIYWNARGTYKYIDTIICCSEFMKKKMDSNPLFADKTVAMHNFVEPMEPKGDPDPELKLPPNYVLYFGRYSWEKGMGTLLSACDMLPEVDFVFAGKGEYKEAIDNLPYATDVGFRTGADLKKLISGALFTVYPSEWYENNPFSVMESQQLGVPVIGANIGGIPELIKDGVTGRLFEPGDARDLAAIIKFHWDNPEMLDRYKKELGDLKRMDAAAYAEWIAGNVYTV